MNIKSLAHETGVSSATIRYYETEGVLPAPSRKLNGYRTYTTDYIEKLNLIKLCQTLGFKLGEIRQLLWDGKPKEHGRILMAIKEKQNHIEEVIDQLEDKKQKLLRLHSVLDESWVSGECLSAEQISELIK